MTNKTKRHATLLNSSSLFVLGTASVLLGSGPAQAFDANALPTGGNVTGGSATIATSGNTLTVNQASNRAIIDWRTFNIGANAQANFVQPDTSSIAVNRVNGSTDPSRIDGGLHANGQVWVLNPNGVFFGKTARVDAAGVVATTANINDKAFMAGSNKLQMTGGDSGQVVNEGHISVGEGGLAAFVAPSVRNSGTIRARVGKVTLAAGDTYTLDLAGDRLVEIGLGSNKAVVDQSGKIINAGGVIDISAKAASQVVDAVINTSGVTDASSVRTVGGKIILGADVINVASTAKISADGTAGGQITAVAAKTGDYAGSYSAQGTTGDGGQIETSGHTVTVASDAKISASSAHGKAGTWTLDPVNVTITSGAANNTTTGGTVTTGTIEASLAGGTGVAITTSQDGSDDGDLTLAASVNATSTGNAGLTLTGRHLSATGGSTINIAGGALTLNVNAVNASATPSGSWINDALKMIGTVGGGSTVNLGAGTYAVAAGGGNYLDVVTPNVTISGAGEGSTIIDASSASTYGLRVQADNVSLKNFTLNGPTSSGGYGIKVEPLENTILPTDRVNNFNIAHVTETGSYKNGLDLNGVASGTIDHVTVSNTTHGTGIAITDSANLTLTNNVTTNNAWGGLALYQHNATYNQQVDGIVADASNTFNEPNAIYTEDESATKDFGTLTLTGYDYVVKSPTNPADVYTWFQKDAASAVSFAATVAPATASVQGKSGDSVNGNNIFTVGSGLKIQSALNTAAAGATVNVLSGTYNEALSIATNGLTLKGTGAIIDAGGAATGVSISTAANLGTITIDGFTIQGWTSRGINQDYNGWSADTAAVHATNNIVYGPAGGATAHGNGIEVSGNGSVVSHNEVHNDHLNSTDWSGSGIIAVNGSNITIDHNLVDGADTGIAVVNWNNTGGMSNIAVTDNIVKHATDEGISIQPFEAEYFGTSSGPISGLSITGNAVSDSASGLGVWDYSSDQRGNWASTITDISGNTFANNTYQISTDFTGANVNPLLSANTFDRSVVNATGGNTIYGDLQTAIDTEADHSTLNLAGTFGAGATVNKAGDSLVGNDAVINVGAGQVGLTINANDVTVQNLEIAGPLSGAYTGLDWTTQPNSWAIQVTSPTVSNFNITGNNIHDVRTGILIANSGNPPTGGAQGAITDNTFENTKGGVIVQYRDGSTITIADNHQGAIGNEWGVVYNTNLNPATIAATPDAARQSFLLDVSNANNGLAVLDRGYTNANRTAVTVDAAATGTPDNGFGNARQPLSTIQAGFNAVVTGGTVNLKDGTYVIPAGGGNYLDITKSLVLKGESEAGTIIDASNASTYGLRVQADDVALSNFTLKGPTAAGGYGIKVEPLELVITPADRVHNFSIANVTETGSYKNGLDLNGVVGATIDNVAVSGTTHGTGIAITDSANVTLTNNTTTGNAWGGLALYEHNTTYDQQVNNITVDGTNSFGEANGVYLEDESASQDFGTVSIAGYDHAVKATVGPNDSYTWLQNGVQTAIDFAAVNVPTNAPTPASVQGWTGSAGDNHFTVGIGANGTALSVNAALDASATGGIIDVLAGTYAEDVAIIAPRTVNFDGATLDSLSVSSTGAGSTLSGSVKAGSVTAFDINLGGDLSVDTSAANGTIALANVDGAHDLTLNAGSGGAVLVGGLGATTRLGAVDITADLIGLGATNKAASFDFNGDVALSAASTVIDTTVSNTAAGNITFAGDIFGTTDGGQSLTLTAGPGTGAKSANGDIAMNNAGISTVRLGSLNVSGDDFTALTVDLAGGFTSQLTGNQLFAADTLNAAGDVNSNVAGNIGGHIVSGGNVTLTAAGGVSGDITGKVVSLTGQTVNSQVTANTLNVNSAQGGTITGTFTPGTVSNGLVVNGTTVGSNTGNTGTGNTGTGNTGTGNTGTGNTGTGNTGTGNTANNFPNVNGQQLVVEGFALPAGTQIGANGQLILPPGTVIGLLSPGGGTPRVIMVQSVQELGALLDQGYVAIVIDLTGHKKAATKVASN